MEMIQQNIKKYITFFINVLLSQIHQIIIIVYLF